MGLSLVLVGYCALIALYGWWALLAIAIHGFIMFAPIWKRKKGNS